MFTGEYTVTSTGDFFGTSVDISGLTVVIGAPGEDSAATGVGGDQTDESAEHAGAAYVFKKPAVGPVWLLQAYLKASNPDGENSSLFFISSADRFGTAVAIDGNLLAVGAPNEDSAATGINGDEADNSLPYAGASYVFSRTDDVWSQQAYLKASNPSAYDGFGASLSLSGTILAVGAPGEDGISTGIDGPEDNDLATDAGACYVFKKPGINWAQFRYLKPSYLKAEAPLNPGEEDPCATPDIDFSGIFTDSDTEPEPELISNDRFGSTVAIDGTVVLGGSPFEDSDATGVDGDQSNSDAPNSGAAYAFDLDAQPPVAQGDIAIQQPLGRGLISGANLIDYGLVGGGEGSTLTFNIANVGGAGLTGINISVIGNHASDFAVSPDSFLIMPAGSTNTFDVTFTPTAAGIRGATLSIASSDIDENPFTIALTGIGVGQNSDQDGDGMTDLAEWNLRFLGFDWQQRQTRLVNYYYNNAQGAGLFTQSQISNLSADPVLGPGSSDDKLTLTMDWKISDDVKSFSDLPATPGEVSLNADGDIVFEFDIPGDRAFFKVLVGE